MDNDILTHRIDLLYCLIHEYNDFFREAVQDAHVYVLRGRDALRLRSENALDKTDHPKQKQSQAPRQMNGGVFYFCCLATKLKGDPT
jgi:hypothetical protein